MRSSTFAQHLVVAAFLWKSAECLVPPDKEMDARKAGGPAGEDVTYVLPIWEGALARNIKGSDIRVLNDMKTKLGQTSFDQTTKTVLGWSFSSFAMCRDTKPESEDWMFVSDNLIHELDLAATTRTPILVHVNDGHWAAGSFPNATNGYDDDTLIEWLARKYPETTMMDYDGKSQYISQSGENWFCMSRLNNIYRKYKIRNVKASAKVIAKWADKHPDLFAGVSLESEPRFNGLQSDYNPYSVQEWKQWLTGTGIYGPNGDYFGHGRMPSFATVEAFNKAMGTSFASWDDLEPPRAFTRGEVFSEEWQRWRVITIKHNNADNTLWLIESGIDRAKIYGHQTPQVDLYGMADDILVSTAPLGAGGYTFYGWDPIDYGRVLPNMRARGSNNWGNFELNPLSTNETVGYSTMEALRDHGIRIICPNAWEDYAHIRDMYALFDSPNFKDAWGSGVKRWLADRESEPRYTQPKPWNPGKKIIDLYDILSDATSSSGDETKLMANASCGGIVRKSIYTGAGGELSWSVKLPQSDDVNKQRLNLWTSLGIRDGAKPSDDEETFQITIDGSPLLSADGMSLAANYRAWKRWVPLLIDITSWAGKTVTITLKTNSKSSGGDMLWGAPQVYQSGSSDENLARGKHVKVSSKRKEGDKWRPEFLVDGKVSSDIYGIGWSSSNHNKPDSTEWAQVDLGSTHNVSKVVLLGRSDSTDANGSGFPVNFDISGSITCNNDDWKTLVTLEDFPGTQGDDGEIFLFETAKARCIRVTATKLRGVSGEKGYAMQLAEMAVFS